MAPRTTTVILLVLVCIATAALLAWLSVELWRITLRGDGVPRSVPAVLHGVVGVLRVSGERFHEARRDDAAEPTPSVPPWEVEETVERMVRERLYGDGHSSRRRVDAA